MGVTYAHTPAPSCTHAQQGFVLDAGSSVTAIAIAHLDLRAASLFVFLSTIKTVCDHR